MSAHHRYKLVPNRRCKTAVAYSRRRQCQSCYTNVVLQCPVDDKSNANFQNTITVLGIHRSKSEVDINSLASHSNSSLQRSQTHLFMSTPQVGEKHSRDHEREEAKIAMTTVPKKGLIKLTALQEELTNPHMFEIREGYKYGNDAEEIERERHKFVQHQERQKMLIKRRDIMEQVMVARHQLEEDERARNERQVIEKQLGEYTIADLHENLNEITFKSFGNKSQESLAKPEDGRKSKPKAKSEEQDRRKVTLPNINNLNVF